MHFRKSDASFLERKNKINRLTKTFIFIFIISIVSISSAASSAVSTSDPLWDWKYDAIERLSLAFDHRGLSNTRPMSRLEMAGIVLEIEAKQEESPGANANYQELLKRLKRDLTYEISILNRKISTDELRVEPLRWVRFKAVHSDSNDQMENDYGRESGRFSLRTELSTSATWKWIGYEIRPQYNFIDEDDNLENVDKLDLHSGYLVTWLKNLEIEVGKDSLWWGPGRHGSLLLTNNAPSFELVKISNAFSSVPPGPFKYLGETKFTFFYGRLSEQPVQYITVSKGSKNIVREIRKPNLTGMRLNFSPAAFIELGVAEAVMVTNRKGERLGMDDFIQAFFPGTETTTEEVYDGPITNRIASLDMALKFGRDYSFVRRLNLEGFRFYIEHGGEDSQVKKKRNPFNLPSLTANASLFGIYIDSGLTEFRAEYFDNYDNIVKWYSHSQFRPEGYRNEGFIMGHHRGGYVRDIYMNLTHLFSSNLVGELSYERWEFKEKAYSDMTKYEIKTNILIDEKRDVSLAYDYITSDVNNNIFSIDFRQRF